ncbi:MAG: SDR family oxidoreductase [Hyphomicrobiaceae bacterium]
MLMSVADLTNAETIYPELAGARVLITGLGPTCGVDLARSFADHGCRLILQIPEPCPETDALLQILSETALEVRAHHDQIDASESATRFTQAAAKAYGGLEAVVNFIRISRYDLNSAVTLEEIESLFIDRMQAAARTTSIAANRMGLTWSNGSILNVLRLPPAGTPAEAAIAGIARTALAALIKAEAGKWADQGVRVNGIAPRTALPGNSSPTDDYIRNEPEIAAVAMYLASQNGEKISGHILDCEAEVIA